MSITAQENTIRRSVQVLLNDLFIYDKLRGQYVLNGSNDGDHGLNTLEDKIVQVFLETLYAIML